MASRRGQSASFVAALLLFALVAQIGGPVVHTDDGCEVERHCRACRLALASAGAAPPDVPQLAESPAAGTARVELAEALCDIPVASEPSRGPPAAL